jgi:hypothetical protein
VKTYTCRERERQTDRQTETERETKKEREREREGTMYPVAGASGGAILRP